MSIFKKLFTKKPDLPSIDWSYVGADMHSHLIPKIDDGVKSEEESIDLIKRFYNLGFRKIITTPHIMGDFYRNTPEVILKGRDIMRKRIEQEGLQLKFEAAAEYYIDFDFERKLEEEKLLTIGDGYVLVEVSYINPPENMTELLFKMQTKGYKVILAHPERYPFWFNNLRFFQELNYKGIYLQLNLNSLSGYYSAEIQKQAELLVQNNLIRFIGSDCHHLEHFESMVEAGPKAALHQLLTSGLLLNGSL